MTSSASCRPAALGIDTVNEVAMVRPLRSIIYGTAVVIIVLLGGILTLGVRQYQLHAHHEQVIAQSEKLLFQFATVREHIIASLLDHRYQQLTGIVREVESMQGEITRIVENAHIPDEYKLSFINQIDLPSIILLLYQGGSGDISAETIQQLNRETRVLGEKLMLFDRVLVNYAKRKVIGFQSVVIGILALAVFIVVNLLVLGHRRLAAPVIHLSRQVREVEQGSRAEIALPRQGVPEEVGELAATFQDLLANRLQHLVTVARQNRILYATNRAGVAARQAANRDELFREVSQALLFNEDYCLVWIGVPDENGQELYPVLADGSATRNERRGETCVALLLAEAKSGEAEGDAAQRAFKQNKPVIDRDILANVPTGHLKDTPLAEGQANCAALPLVWGQKLYGVLVIYSTQPQSFADEEVKLLVRMAGDVSFALAALDLRRELAARRKFTEGLCETAGVAAALLDAAGVVRSCYGDIAAIFGAARQEMIGRQWHELIASPQGPQDRSSGPPSSLPVAGEEEATIMADGREKLLCCHYVPVPEDIGEQGVVLCVVEDVTSRRLLATEASARGHLFEGLRDPAFIVSADGRILESNGAGRQVLGSEGRDLTGADFCELAVPAGAGEIEARLRELLQKRAAASLEEQLVMNGESYQLSVSPLGDPADTDRLLLVARRLPGELSAASLETVRVSQLAALGQLTSGVAHEINNMSNGIINYAQVLADEAREEGWSSDHEQVLGRIIGEGERIAEIAQKLLVYDLENGNAVKRVPLSEVIDDTLLLVRHHLRGDGIRVESDFPADLPVVPINVLHMQQVFLNIINNARRALNERYPGKHENKKMEISGEVVSKEGRRWLRTMVVDHGVGLDSEAQARLFDPSFTSRPDGIGGLGMAISRELVAGHDGHLEVKSAPGEWTAVVVDLPIGA